VRRLARYVLVTIAAAAAAPASAQAGSYHVYTCAVAGAQHANAAWGGAQVARIVVDTGCSKRGELIGLRIDGGQTIPNGAAATLTFTSPPGTTIADFTVDRELAFNSNPPAANTRPLYALYRLGSAVFAGAGDYHTPTRNRLKAFNAWYGHPANDAHLTRRTTRLADMGALAGYRGDAQTLSIEVGCFRRATDCSAPGGERVYHVLYGTDITVNDPHPPTPAVAAEGLLAGGPRHGSDPVVLSATDNVGVRRVELFDVTTGTPALVGARTLRCSYRYVRPCGDLPRTTVTPTALQVGQRSLVVRTIDAAGNGTDSGPFPVSVITPSDRGARNGRGATDTATVTARFAKGGRKARTVPFKKLVRVRGSLQNSSGQPIADARLELVAKNRKPGARWVRGKTVTTGEDGSFAFTTRARSSRTLTIGWKSYLNDGVYAAYDRVQLRARAAARLYASTRAPLLGRKLTLRGRLHEPARGVTVILQGRRPGSRRFTTFADTTTRKGGRFRVGYRFRDPASRGQRFTFRAKLKPNRSYPFETGYSRRVHVRVR
jgi:hypothetical protein